MVTSQRARRRGTNDGGPRSAPRRAVWVAALGALATSLPSAARADGRARFALVRGARAEQCPSQERVAQMIAQRAGAGLLDPRADRLVEALLGRDGERWTAQIFVRDAANRSLGSRELSFAGQSCDALTDALVLAVALAIDPDVAVEAPRPASALTLTPPTPPASTDGRGPTVARPAAVRDARLGLGVGAWVGIAPSIAPTLSVEGLSARRGPVRLSIAALRSFARTTDDGAFAFTLTALRVGACVGASLGRLTGDACLELAPAVLQAVVLDTTRFAPVAPGDRPYVAALLPARGAVRLFDALELEAAVTPGLAFVRPRFVLTDGAVVYEPSVVTIGAWLGLHTRFE